MPIYSIIILFCLADILKLFWNKCHVSKEAFSPQNWMRIIVYLLFVCLFFAPVGYTSNLKVTSVLGAASLNVEENQSACLAIEETLDQYWFARDFIRPSFKVRDYSSSTFTIILNRETPSLKNRLLGMVDEPTWIIVTPEHVSAALKSYGQSYHLLGNSLDLYDSISNIVETTT